MPTPTTHNHGSKTIDTIHISQTLLDVEGTGWLWFEEVVGKHWIAFLYINVAKLINTDKHEIVQQTVV